MTAGSHHMLLLYSQGATNGPLIDCPQGGLQFGNYTFGAQSEKASQTYPDGVGAFIPTGMGFTVDAHYVNTGATPLQGAVTITMFVARPGLVTQHAGVLSFILTSISIPATGAPVTASGTCPVGQAATSSGRGPTCTSARRTSSRRPARRPSMRRTSGPSRPRKNALAAPPACGRFQRHVGVHVLNDTGSTLTFGPSALTNVMCNFSAAFYPVQDPSNPVVSCMQ